MTINTNSLVEEVFPFLYFAVLADFCYQPHYSFRIIADFHPLVNPFFKRLVTHTGFEPMLTA